MSGLARRWPLLWTLYRKELRAYFDTPTAYVVTIVVTLIAGYLFASPLFLVNRAVLDGFVETAPLLFIFFVPAVTMRLYAEEKKSGTLEVLATLPVEDEEVLITKYCAAMTVVAFMLAGSMVYPLTLFYLGSPDGGSILCSYLGLLFTGSVLASAGIWASSLSRNQIIAFIVSFLVGFSLFLMGKVSMFVPQSLAPLTDFLGLDAHLRSISRGVLDSRDLFYYASVSGFFLYLTYLNVHFRRLYG